MMITPNFSMADIEAEINKKIEEQTHEIINTLEYIGIRCVSDAIANRGYTDQTGNLKASIGYMVLNNGVTVSASEGSESSQSREFLNSLVAEHSRGIVLIVVAGMQYASYVEAIGRNVLASAELLAEREVPEMLKQLGFKLN